MADTATEHGRLISEGEIVAEMARIAGIHVKLWDLDGYDGFET